MTSKQRAYLKSLANNLNPVFQVGKSSLTPEFTKGIEEAFNTRELLKIAVLKNCFDDPNEIAQVVAERTHSQVVQVIGKKIILYKLLSRLFGQSQMPVVDRIKCSAHDACFFQMLPPYYVVILYPSAV